jgi:hypothetical protein
LTVNNPVLRICPVVPLVTRAEAALFVTLYGAGALPLATGVGVLTIGTLPPARVVSARFADSPKAALFAAVVTQAVGVGVGVAVVVGVFVGVLVKMTPSLRAFSPEPAAPKKTLRGGSLVFAGDVTAASRPRVNAKRVVPTASSVMAPSPSERRRTAAERHGRFQSSFEILCAAAVIRR